MSVGTFAHCLFTLPSPSPGSSPTVVVVEMQWSCLAELTQPQIAILERFLSMTILRCFVCISFNAFLLIAFGCASVPSLGSFWPVHILFPFCPVPFFIATTPVQVSRCWLLFLLFVGALPLFEILPSWLRTLRSFLVLGPVLDAGFRGLCMHDFCLAVSSGRRVFGIAIFVWADLALPVCRGIFALHGLLLDTAAFLYDWFSCLPCGGFLVHVPGTMVILRACSSSKKEALGIRANFFLTFVIVLYFLPYTGVTCCGGQSWKILRCSVDFSSPCCGAGRL